MLQPLTRPEIRRAVYAVAAVALAEIIGTIGFHLIESVNWVDAFYFESMLATGQGPPFTLYTDAGKIFASIMGFVSVGSVLSAVIFVLGPFALRLWRESMQIVEREARTLERVVVGDVRKLDRELTGHRSQEAEPPAPPPH
jgi:hypothetical protein